MGIGWAGLEPPGRVEDSLLPLSRQLCVLGYKAGKRALAGGQQAFANSRKSPFLEKSGKRRFSRERFGSVEFGGWNRFHEGSVVERCPVGLHGRPFL